MTTKFIKAIRGNVSVKVSDVDYYFTEGLSFEVDSAVEASEEVQGFITDGFLVSHNSLIDSDAHIFTPLATLLAMGENVSRPIQDYPSGYAAKEATHIADNAAYLAALSYAARKAADKIEAQADKTANDDASTAATAAANAAPGNQGLADAAVAALAAKAITDTVYTSAAAKKTAADLALASALSAKNIADAALIP